MIMTVAMVMMMYYRGWSDHFESNWGGFIPGSGTGHWAPVGVNAIPISRRQISYVVVMDVSKLMDDAGRKNSYEHQHQKHQRMTLITMHGY